MVVVDVVVTGVIVGPSRVVRCYVPQSVELGLLTFHDAFMSGLPYSVHEGLVLIKGNVIQNPC